MKSLRQQLPTVTLAAGAAGTRAMWRPERRGGAIRWVSAARDDAGPLVRSLDRACRRDATYPLARLPMAGPVRARVRDLADRL